LFADTLTSAAEQGRQAERYRHTHEPGKSFISLAISAQGYKYLDFPTEEISLQFRKGMKKADLGDPPSGKWEPKFQGHLHALLILADDRVENLTELFSRLRDDLESFADVSMEFGLTMRNADENPIEHFGYADGVSQPIFFESDMK